MSNLRKLLMVLILAAGFLPAAANNSEAYCYGQGYVYVPCYPTDADSCRYGCATVCQNICWPVMDWCITGMWCDWGGERCYCACEAPCPCPGGC